jgi:hypothetical protein
MCCLCQYVTVGFLVTGSGVVDLRHFCRVEGVALIVIRLSPGWSALFGDHGFGRPL